MGQTSELDLVEELRLRRWARENYVPAALRNPDWHPVIHLEMNRRDQESARNSSRSLRIYRIDQAHIRTGNESEKGTSPATLPITDYQVPPCPGPEIYYG